MYRQFDWRHDELVACCQMICDSDETNWRMALRHESQIDFILVSKPSYITDFHVLDPSINFSDHVPLLVTTKCLNVSKAKSKSTSSSNHVKFNLNSATLGQGW